MFFRLGQLFVIALPLLWAVSGCNSQPEWDVTVENKGHVPCSFFVTMRADGSSKANTIDVAKDSTIILISGRGDTIIHTVKVVRGKDEQLLTPDTKLPSGKRYSIVAEADGKVATSVLDK